MTEVGDATGDMTDGKHYDLLVVGGGINGVGLARGPPDRSAACCREIDAWNA
ncbi:MAG: hypothetical protein QOI13_3038, partial [Paraburkholderia sp.]|nr:hypothetical protein [Paraburkholderia sp.]